MSVTLATEQPFNPLARQMSKMLEQMHKGYFGFSNAEIWTPNVNLYETETAYVVCVDLAGVDKDKIEVVVADQRLKLRGGRPVPTHPEPSPADCGPRRLRVHLMEIDHGAFSREVELPRNVDKERISAAYRDGLLWIELPKK
jgi:HSP20 family protein